VLGFIGFIIAALLVGSFAVSFYKYFPSLRQHSRYSFTAAFALLATSLAVWGVAPLLNNASATPAIVFAGDALLLLGTGYLLSAQFKASTLWMLLPALIGAVILTLRGFVLEPGAAVQDGILHFNLEGEARIVLIAILAFVWMPLGTRITQHAVISKGLPQFKGLIAIVFITSLVFAATFIAARKTEIIIATFAALAFTFLLLAVLPFAIDKVAKRLVHTAHPKLTKKGRA
jgi:hypothetical protein